MQLKINALRPFVGAINFEVSRAFYRELGFEEMVINPGLSVFESGQFGFYLQNYYVKEWLENTMLFIEVSDVNQTYHNLQQKQLDQKYAYAKLLPIKKEDWGETCFVIDPSGALLHFTQLLNKPGN